MLKVIPRRPFVLVLVAAVAWSLLGIAAQRAAHAFCRLTTAMPQPGDTCAEHGTVLAWHRQCIGYSVMSRQSRVPALGPTRAVVDRSFTSWNAVRCNGHTIGLQLEQTNELGACARPEYNSYASNANTIIFVTDWSQRGLPADVFGMTMVWHDPHTGEIFDADMQLNETMGPLTICDQVCPAGAVDIQNMITHEAGHFLGLGHSSVSTATMSADANIGETNKRQLSDDDRQALCSIYAAFPATSCQPEDFLPNHGFAPECAPPSSAGARAANCDVVGPPRRGLLGGAGALLALSLLACSLRWRSRRRRGNPR